MSAPPLSAIHRHPRRRHRLARVVAVAGALVLIITGCGPQPDEPAGAPTADEPSPTADDGGDAAGGTTMDVYDVPEARSATEDGSLHVVGLLIDDGSGWRLCEAVLESYPPQCGGDSLAVEGLDPSLFTLEQEGEVRWQTAATLVGEIDGDVLTVTGSAASS